MQVIDLLSDDSAGLWEQTVDYIRQSNDTLKENYINIDFREFLSFPVLVSDNKIICFSGLQYNEQRWGVGVGRFSSRMWIHPDHRIQSMSKFSGGAKFLNSMYCLPVQMKKARERGLDTIFISREHNPVGFGQYVDLLKINCDLDFKIKPNRYNVCGEDAVCVQYVAVHHLTDIGKETWIKNMTKYLIIE
jgi:hypothetical protein